MTVLFTPAQYLISLKDTPPGFIRERVAVLRKLGKMDAPIAYGIVLINLVEDK